MEDIIQHADHIYIKASSSLADQRTRVIKHGELFAIFDVFGDIKTLGTGAQGLFREATRFLSRMELKLGGKYPLFLSSAINSENTLFTVDLSNPDMHEPDGRPLHKGSFHIFRNKFLTDEACYERLQITNFSNEAHSLELSFRFSSDFADMFEIRGMHRKNRGVFREPQVAKDSITFTYDGLDRKSRHTRITFYPAPKEISDRQATFIVNAAAGERLTFFITIGLFEDQTPTSAPATYYTAFTKVENWSKRHSNEGCHITASSERFNNWLNRSRSDILLMLTATDTGDYPYAGIPWFNTVFGRDGIITALQYLWVNPRIAEGVLKHLAKHQAREDRPDQDAEPGKILHEFRKGEMVDTGEVPFKNYYGSADSTPLFIILAGHYLDWTLDRQLLEQLWPHIQNALHWIDKYGDLDGDGFVEYQRRSPNGLLHQGWKDSSDPISFGDGRLADTPIALCEVQGYVYEAKLQAAKIARLLGFKDYARELTTQAGEFRERFEAKFWSDELGMFVIALDKDKKQCNIQSSNAGHCLYSGIASSEQARRIAEKLLSKDMFSGWGIRTLSQAESRYNPMSYHNGSVWPHDNAIIAEGFNRYGLKEECIQVLTAMFEVSMNMDLLRLPELFCGFSRRPGEGPTLYPVACSPQAWAAGAPFMLLKAALGLHVDSIGNRIMMKRPVLPKFLTELRIENLKTSRSSVDLFFRRHGDDVSVFVERRSGNPEITIIK